jgi:biotin--protein ligase
MWGNRNIAEFVRRGGNFLGLCAGAYYGCAAIAFEPGGPLEVIAQRELRFFPGRACGPVYSLGKFRYQSEEGAEIARLDPSSAVYYNGGCAFLDAEAHASVTVLARYADVAGRPPAIIQCAVGAGQALLSGVHPEYSAHWASVRRHLPPPLLAKLRAAEQERRALFRTLIEKIV